MAVLQKLSPKNLLLVYMITAAAVWVVQCSLLQNILGLDILETVIWGAQGAWGHAKHPPLSGWIGYFFSKISGHQDWSMYLLAQLCLVAGGWFTYKTARLFYDEYSACTSALLLFFLFYYTPSETKFSTYFVEIMLQPLTVYSFFTALRRRKWYNYAFLGLCGGLGLLNKYSYGLLLAGLAIIVLCNREYRKQLLTFGPYLSLIVCISVIFPHLQWLAENDFICFKHVNSRMHEKHDWFLPFVVLSAMVYPFIVHYGVLMAANYLCGDDKRKKNSPQWEIFRWSMILTLIPALVFLGLSIAGKGVILMWFCSTVSFTGIGVIAVFPKKIDYTLFRRVYIFLWIFFIAVLVLTTGDLLFKSRPRLHTEPEAITTLAMQYWQEQRSDPIPVVIGPRWYAAVIENYTPGRPPACELGDPVFMERYREKILKHGALLIGNDDIIKFGKTFGCDDLRLRKATYSYKAIFGKRRSRNIYLGYYPSKSEREHYGSETLK